MVPELKGENHRAQEGPSSAAGAFEELELGFGELRGSEGLGFRTSALGSRGLGFRT